MVVIGVAVLWGAGSAGTAHALDWAASSYPVTVSGSSAEGNEVIGTEAGNIECSGSFSGALEEESESLWVEPTYSECAAFGFLSATVAMNGCEFVWHTNEETDIVCPGGGKIVITSGTCEITISAQSNLSTFSVSNKATDVEVKVFLTGVQYTVTKDGMFCSFNGTGTRTNGTWQETVAVTMQGSGGVTVAVH